MDQLQVDGWPWESHQGSSGYMISLDRELQCKTFLHTVTVAPVIHAGQPYDQA